VAGRGGAAMKRLLCATVCLALAGYVGAEVDIDLPAVKRLSLPAIPQRYFQLGDKLVIVTVGTPKAVILDLRAFGLAPLPIEPLSSVLGVDRRGVAAHQYVESQDGSGHREVFFFDPHTGVRTNVSTGLRSLSGEEHIYYQNEESFHGLVHGEWEQELSLFSLRTGEERGLGWIPGVSSAYLYPPFVISRDKQTLVVKESRGFTIYHPNTRTFGPILDESLGSAVFLTNGVVLLLIGARIVYDVAGNRIGDLRLQLPDGYGTDVTIWFSEDLKYGVFAGRTRKVDLVVVDASALRNWLDSLGLLFRETTGVVNAQEVRIRENANLQAYVFGTVGKGDAVAVLDRSGIRERVGNTEDWWYRVRRAADGLEGWMYGTFLDLKQERR
jgi:hypothetical protein